MTELLNRVLGYAEGTEEDLTLKIPKLEPSEETDECSASETSSSSPIASPYLAIVKQEELSPPEQCIELTCGELVGYLHRDRFLCPGIRVPCIETADEPGKLLTPVEYTVKAGKDKQKDWKGSIKCRGKVLRSLMDNKQLDFYNHDTMCSAKCQSRNYMSAKMEKPMVVKMQKATKAPKPYQRPNQLPVAPISKEKLQEQLLQNPNIQVQIAKFLADQKQQTIQKNTATIQSFIIQKPVHFCQSVIHEGKMERVAATVAQKIGHLAQELMTNGPNFTETATRFCMVMQVLGMDATVAQGLATAQVNSVKPAMVQIPQNNGIPSIPTTSASPDHISLEAIQNLTHFQNQNVPLATNNNHLSPTDILQQMAKQLAK